MIDYHLLPHRLGYQDVSVQLVQQLEVWQSSRSSKPPSILCRAQRTRPQGADLLRSGAGDLSKARPLGRGKKVHLQPFPAQADLVQQALDVVDPFLCLLITFQVMTGPG